MNYQDKKIEINSWITGNHAYKHIWTPVLGEVLNCSRDIGNAFDENAIKVVNDEGTTIRHVPRELSIEFSNYLTGRGTITAEVVGKRENKWTRGLEVPALYRILKKN